MGISKKLNSMLHINKSLEEKLYIVLSEKEYTEGSYKKESIGEGMSVIYQSIWGWWKPRYLVDENIKHAYEIMDEQMDFVYFSMDDIDWESVKTLPRKAVDCARSLSAQFPSFIRNFENGVAEVSWQLNPDGRYYMDDDGFGMTSDEEITVYGFIDTHMKVLVKFQYIGKDWERLKQMRLEAENLHKSQH